MPDGFLQRTPDLGSLEHAGSTAQSQVGGLFDTLGSLAGGGDASPISAVTGALGGLDGLLDIDVSGLSERLPAAIDVARSAAPADALAYVESIETAYSTVRGFLDDSAIAREIGEGGNLQDVALAVIDDALSLFDSRITELTGSLIGTDALNGVRSAFDSISDFTTDFPTDSSGFLPFLSSNLIGVGPDLLADPLDHIASTLSILASLEPDALATSMDSARQALSQEIDALSNAIQGFDPADQAAYGQILATLDDIETAVEAVATGATSVYDQVENAIGAAAPRWESRNAASAGSSGLTSASS